MFAIFSKFNDSNSHHLGIWLTIVGLKLYNLGKLSLVKESEDLK